MKYFYWSVGVLFFLFSLSWIFNHINAWLAILLPVVAIGIILNLTLNKKTKKNEKDN